MRSVDAWCADRERSDVFGQIAEPGAQGYRPVNFEWRPFLGPQEFKERLESATLVVAHAGMGSIISALTIAKPLVIMPRRADFREHRNDHQVATAEQFAAHAGIFVAADESELPQLLDTLTQGGAGSAAEPLSPFAEPRLIEAIRRFIHGESGSLNRSESDKEKRSL